MDARNALQIDGDHARARYLYARVLEKEQILQRMKPNLATLDHLMDCNLRDFRR